MVALPEAHTLCREPGSLVLALYALGDDIQLQRLCHLDHMADN